MDECTKCRSYAINHNHHGRDGSEPDLCDVCFWRKRAEDADTRIREPEAEVRASQLLRIGLSTLNTELETEVTRLKAAIAQSCDEMRYETLSGCERAETAEATLARVRAALAGLLQYHTEDEFGAGLPRQYWSTAYRSAVERAESALQEQQK